jgi:hypothetical protein
MSRQAYSSAFRQQMSPTAEFSLERIAFRLGEDIARLQRQLDSLSEEAESPLRSSTLEIYGEMLAKRLELLNQVEVQLKEHSASYEAIAL